MADIIAGIFRRRKIVLSRLESFGFLREGANYTYRRTLAESGFQLTVRVTPLGEVSAEVTDPAFHEPYTLHLADGAVGGFVGGVRSAYEDTLTEIARQCCEPEVFKSGQAKDLIVYVRDTYGDELEYLWRTFPDNAVWRRKDTGKWYGAALTVSRRKLGLKSDELAEIIDLRCPPEELKELVDGKIYFSGWHMNKKNWYTIILDGSVGMEELCHRVDRSYLLAVK